MSGSQAIEAAILKSFASQTSTLYKALEDNEGLETCADLMFGIVTRCRSLSKHIIDSMSIADKFKLDQHCQDAMQAVAYMAQVIFAPDGDASTDLEISSMCYLPTRVTKLPRDELGLRFRSIKHNMAGLWSMTADNPGVVNSARKVLRLCSGAPFRLHSLDGWTLNLEGIDFAPIQAKPEKRALFHIVVLTLTCLARSHSAWFNAMLPSTANKRAVVLFGMEVPGTGENVQVGKVIAWKAQGASNMTYSTEQRAHLNSLYDELRSLRDFMPTTLPSRAADESSAQPKTGTSAPPTAAQLHMRAATDIDVVKRVIAGRSLERDSLDEHYASALFFCGQIALTDLFIAAKLVFNISAEPTATKPAVHQAARNERPRPVQGDAEGQRTWNILRLLDQLALAEPSSAERVRWPLTGVIIALCEGEKVYGSRGEPISELMLAIPAVTEKSESWRRQMLLYVQFVIVAVAQHLSSHFDGREVRVDGKLVMPWRDPVNESVFANSPKYKVAYGFGGVLGEWEKDGVFDLIAISE